MTRDHAGDNPIQITPPVTIPQAAVIATATFTITTTAGPLPTLRDAPIWAPHRPSTL